MSTDHKLYVYHSVKINKYLTYSPIVKYMLFKLCPSQKITRERLINNVEIFTFIFNDVKINDSNIIVTENSYRVYFKYVNYDVFYDCIEFINFGNNIDNNYRINDTKYLSNIDQELNTVFRKVLTDTDNKITVEPSNSYKKYIIIGTVTIGILFLYNWKNK